MGIPEPVFEGYGRHSELVIRLTHEYSENNVAVLGIISTMHLSFNHASQT